MDRFRPALSLPVIFSILAALLLLSFALPLLSFVPELSVATLAAQLGRTELFRAVGISLASATLATVIMGALGIPLGYLMARDELVLPRTARVLVLLPLVLPPVAAGVLLLGVYGPAGIIGAVLESSGWSALNAFGGIVLSQIFVAAPFVVLTAEASFRAVDPALEQAAATLGQTRGRTFRRVALPLARYGLAAGLALAWMRAVGEFGATMVMSYHPHSLPVYLWIELSGRGLSAALPVALVALILATLVLFVAQLMAFRERGTRPAPDRALRGPAREPAAATADLATRPAAAERTGPDPRLELDARYEIAGFTLDVRLDAGREILSLFGPSGAGKTTLLRLISGLARPSDGWLRLDGDDLFRATAAGDPAMVEFQRWVPPHQRPVGMVFQDHMLFPHLTVRENIRFGIDRSEGDRDARVAELIAMTRLDGLEDRYPPELSGGQQQRVALSRALIRRPRVLLLDEPFSSLDSNMKERLLLDVRRIQEAFGVCVIYVTHDLRDASSLGDRLAVIADGRIEQVGDPLEVIRRPTSYPVARFVGVRNLFRGRIIRREGQRVVLGLAGLELEADGCREDLTPGRTVHFGVRPEDIVVLKPERPVRPPADQNVLSGRIVLERLRGPTYTLTFRVDGTGDRSPPLDLEVELPVRSYEALGIRDHPDWRVSIRRNALHVLPG